MVLINIIHIAILSINLQASRNEIINFTGLAQSSGTSVQPVSIM